MVVRAQSKGWRTCKSQSGAHGTSIPLTRHTCWQVVLHCVKFSGFQIRVFLSVMSCFKLLVGVHVATFGQDSLVVRYALWWRNFFCHSAGSDIAVGDLEITPVSAAIARHLGIDLTPEGRAARNRRGIAVIVHGPPMSGGRLGLILVFTRTRSITQKRLSCCLLLPHYLATVHLFPGVCFIPNVFSVIPPFVFYSSTLTVSS